MANRPGDFIDSPVLGTIYIDVLGIIDSTVLGISDRAELGTIDIDELANIDSDAAGVDTREAWTLEGRVTPRTARIAPMMAVATMRRFVITKTIPRKEM